MDEAERAAHHESGHAWAAVWLDVPVAEVAVGDGGHGATRAGGIAWTTSKALLLAAAGSAAERLKFGTDEGGCSDDVVIGDLLAIRGIPEEQRDASRRDVDRFADELVRQGEQAIDALASVLLVRRRLSGAEATAILHEFDDAAAGAETRDALDDEYRDLVDEHRVVEFDPRVDHEEMLTRACDRYGFTRAEAQEEFNRDCRRRHGLDGYRTQVREYGFTAA